jgi:hypothetical protein
VDAPNNNRTDWSTTGGSLKLELHHPWTYIFVNLGLGYNVTNFNYTLTPYDLWNATGNGTLCVPQLTLPSTLTPADGQNATLQVITIDHKGTALYNCADITFKANVAAFGGAQCQTSPGVSAQVITQQAANGSSNGGGSGGGNNTAGGTKPNAAAAGGVSTLALTMGVGLAIVLSLA